MKKNEIIKIADKCMRERIKELEQIISLYTTRISEFNEGEPYKQYQKLIKKYTDELDKIITARSLLFTLES